MQKIEPALGTDVLDILRLENAVAARTSFGGTAPSEVRNRIADARKHYLDSQ